MSRCCAAATWINREIWQKVSLLNKRIFPMMICAALAFVLGCHMMQPATEHREPPARELSQSATAGAQRADTAADKTAERASAVKDGDTKAVLLISFGWPEGPAENIRRSFLYAARQAFPPYTVDIVQCGSPWEATAACDSVMQVSEVRLVVFAGDEGSAASVALLSAKRRVPVLKLTSDTKSFAPFSTHLFELLPSGEKQAEALGQFTVRDLHLAQTMILRSNDARGITLGSSFERGVTNAGGTLDVTRSYEPETQNIRPELAEIFSDQRRLARGAAPLKAALTPEERTEVFGDAHGGEVLFSGTEEDSTSPAVLTGEGLFVVLTPDKVGSYAAQLTMLPKGTILLGNSSWINPAALSDHDPVTSGMHIVAPLLPKAVAKDGLIDGYEAEKSGEANEWELLGLDAGEFVGKVMNNPRGRQDLTKIIPQMPRFVGRVVEVDFGGAHENRLAKILRFENGELIPER
jgi:hypothetical protein